MSEHHLPQLPRKAVLSARNIAFEHRLFPVGDGKRLPSPEPNEKEAYAVLHAIGLLKPESQQWSTRGRKVLQLSDAGFNAIFEHHLDKLLRFKNGVPLPPRPSPNGRFARGATPVSAAFALQW